MKNLTQKFNYFGEDFDVIDDDYLDEPVARIVERNCRDAYITNGYVCIADYGVEMFCNYKCSKCNYGVRI